MRRILIIMLTLSGIATADNLLANPGFEELQGNLPARWALYVMPQTGSWGRVDSDTTRSGKYSISLRITTPYVVEPANNFSQTITSDLRKAELAVRGYIKTEDVTEAAIWLQCFRKSPLATLKAASTSDSTPMRGTRDWTMVEARVTVPEGTDFVVCRCVLQGRGSAWFDDVSVEKVAPDAPAPVEKDAVPPKPVVSATPALPPLPPKDTAIARPNKKDGAALEEARRVSQELLNANAELRASNRSMQEQIKQLRDGLRALRQDIRRESAATPPPGAPPPSARPDPPLVPHDYSLEKKP